MNQTAHPAPTARRRSFAYDLAELCAPTLARLKPASLFRYQPAPGQNAAAMAAAWHRVLAPRGVAVRVLKQCPVTGAVLVYVYRPAWVARLLGERAALDFLQTEGYRPADADGLLDQLADRLCCEGEFPHEIGVFLGYPLADVQGFISHRGQNYACCGYWKVYTDPAAAQACFARYKRCEQIYSRCYRQGTPISRLAVPA